MPKHRHNKKIKKSSSKYKGMGKASYMAWVRSHRKKWLILIFIIIKQYIYIYIYIYIIYINKLNK